MSPELGPELEPELGPEHMPNEHPRDRRLRACFAIAWQQCGSWRRQMSSDEPWCVWFRGER